MSGWKARIRRTSVQIFSKRGRDSASRKRGMHWVARRPAIGPARR